MEEDIIVIIDEEEKEIISEVFEKEFTKIKPDLENLEIIPSTEEQKFKSEKDGYNEITVKPIETEELVIVPSAETKTYKGLFNKITIEGDEDLVPENIAKNKNIFGVIGTGELGNANTVIFGDASNKKAWIGFNLKKLTIEENTDLGYAFYDNESLISVDEIVGKPTRLYMMFYGCDNLQKVGVIDCSEMPRISTGWGESVGGNIFYNCKKLVDFGGFIDLGKSYTSTTVNDSNCTISISACSALSYESLMNLINGLYDLNLTYDVANGGTLYRQSCIVGTTNLEKLQATEEGLLALAEADRKGWNVT